MTAQTDSRIHRRFQIVRLRRSSHEGDSDIFRPGPDLVDQPTMKTGPHMARDTTDIFMRGLRPALVGRGNGMTSGTELGVIGQGNCNPRQSDRSNHDGQYNRGPRRPAHAPGAEAETAESRAQPHRRYRPDAAQVPADQSVCRRPPREDHRTNRKFRPTDHAPRQS